MYLVYGKRNKSLKDVEHKINTGVFDTVVSDGYYADLDDAKHMAEHFSELNPEIKIKVFKVVN
tara:strand:+ start:370 stop:558 length:189 start_codon:yes stop_codon:yes gene_type:complete